MTFRCSSARFAALLLAVAAGCHTATEPAAEAPEPETLIEPTLGPAAVALEFCEAMAREDFATALGLCAPEDSAELRLLIAMRTSPMGIFARGANPFVGHAFAVERVRVSGNRAKVTVSGCKDGVEQRRTVPLERRDGRWLLLKPKRKK